MRRLLHVSNLLILLAAGILAAPLPARAQAVAAAAPDTVGISSARLGRLAPTMQQYVDAGRAPGVVTIVMRQGKVVHL